MTTFFTVLGYIFAVLLICFLAVLFFVTCRGLTQIIAEHEDFEPEPLDVIDDGKPLSPADVQPENAGATKQVVQIEKKPMRNSRPRSAKRKKKEA